MSPHVSPEAEAERIAAAVRCVPNVAGLHGGKFGEIATIVPARRITGVRVRDDEVTVAVTVRYPFSAYAVSEAIRSSIGDSGRPVHVRIADLADGRQPGADPAAAGSDKCNMEKERTS